METICLKQWIKPSKVTKVRAAGMGDCQTCTPDWDNQKCIGFCPITAPVEHEVK